MRTRRFVHSLVVMILCTAFFSPGASVVAGSPNQFAHSLLNDRDDVECLPGIESAVRRNSVYRELFGVLAPKRESLRMLLAAVVNQTTYAALLAKARQVASGVDNGRMVITLADGTVVVDTAPGADNTYQNFVDKNVNENHNSRVAIFAAQLYPCGIGLERKLSTSTGDVESYLALRLGRHLDSAGTARLSTIQED